MIYYLLPFFFAIYQVYLREKKIYRCCVEPESKPKGFYNTFGESSNDLNGCDDNDVITENLALETENGKRNRLDSFYSATSAKSTYFSTGSASSYHSMEDNDSTEIGMLLKSNVPLEFIMFILINPSLRCRKHL